MSDKPLTNTLKAHRTLRNWTQAELAHRVDVTRKTINMVENGRCVPSVYLALKIAKAFGVSVKEFYQLDGECDRGVMDANRD
ncbi:helix-turn-helix transcriptional regulator [Candidatus Bipolaricaulota bacterium]|nr:helix-turn-helix transcriptional regulator [Candidatus Bipolaricaulota bacterium]